MENSNSIKDVIGRNPWATLITVSSTIVAIVVSVVVWVYDKEIALYDQEIGILERTLEQKESITQDTIQGLQSQINQLTTRLGNDIETVSVISAHYGNMKLKDVTNWFASKCNGKMECILKIQPEKIFGDHEPFIEKGIKIAYRCRSETANKVFEMQPFKEPAEAIIRLLCNETGVT